MENILTIAGVSDATISLVPEAIKYRDKLVADAAMITAIADAIDADVANATLREIHQQLKAVEVVRKEIKRPVDELAKRIQDTVKSYCEKLDEQKNRLSALLGSYQAAEVAKAEEDRKKAEIAARCTFIKNHLEVAKAEEKHGEDSPEARAAREAAIDKQAAANAVVAMAAPAKLKGAALCKTWKFEVTDIEALMKYSRDLVTITPNTAAINAVIKNNKNVPGLRIWEEAKATVR